MNFLYILLILFFTAGPLADGHQQPENAANAIPPLVGLDILFISPANGQKIAAGNSLDIILKIENDHELETVMVIYPGGGLILEPPFRETLVIPRDKIGEMSFMAMGTTTNREMISSRNITIEVEVRDAELTTISVFDDHPHLTGPGDVRSMTIYGQYSDGVRREITDYHTSYSVAEGADVACVTEDGIIVGRAPGAASVSIKHGDVEKTILVNVGDEAQVNNPPQPVLKESYEGKAGQKLCLSALDSRDHDACRGEPLTEESFHWTVDLDSTSVAGTGSEFCYTPTEAGLGIIKLEVTDKHGASSETFAMVIID